MHEGKITISRPMSDDEEGYVEITLKDTDACVGVVTIRIALANFAEAVTGLGLVDCTFKTTKNVDKVGLRRQVADLIFEIPDGLSYSHDRGKELARLAKIEALNDWEPQLYFRSQDSFFKEDGKSYARTTQYRWVEK